MCWAQGYYLLREKQTFIGTAAWEVPTCALQDAQGRLFIAGYTQSSPAALPDGWILCLTPEGEVAWALTPGGMGADRIEDLAESDSILYFCGSSGSALTHPEDLPVDRRSDCWAGAIHKNTGRLLWQTRWGSPYLDQARTICPTPYRTLLVGGVSWTDPQIGMQGALYILRASTGEVLQERFWGVAPSLIHRIRPLPGTTSFACIGEQQYRPFVARLDYLGQVYWRTVFQFHRFPSALHALYTTPAGQIIVGGQYNQRWGISLLDTEGRVVWEKLWPQEGPHGTVQAIFQGPEGILYATGWQYTRTLSSPEYKGGRDVWLAALTPHGKLLWERGFGGPYDEEGIALTATDSILWLIAAKENRFSEDPPHPDTWALRFKAVPCSEVPAIVRTDTPSLREKAGRPIRFWLELPPPYQEAAIAWDFGDGGSATGKEVSHIFPEPGTFSVQATLSLRYGCSPLPLPPLTLRITRP